MTVLFSEWLKTKHTIVRWIIFLMPFFISICVMTYIGDRTDVSINFIYESFFMVWSSIIVPIGVGLLTGFFIHEEELAGSFNRLLNIEISREKIYIGKFLITLASLTICTVLTTLLISIGLDIMLPNKINYLLFLLASLLTILGALPILAIHTWISFSWGMGVSIGVGICGILMAVLIGTTSLGNSIWYLIPWAFPVKMAMFPITFSFLSDSMLSKVILQNFLTFILSILFCIVFLVLGMIWFHKWEGRKYSE